ncbi:MAG: type VI secretion system tube protein Hcp [Myxococcales bacterium]|jgi:type VI secretion system secreted protein Hcp|nr:type VI secretion system tube protein Hcp [Myxococcales bacterium]
MASDAYLKIKDVPGSSSDKDHKDWVEVLSHSFSMHMPIGAGPGGVRNAGRVNIEDFVITKAVDKASPSMMQHCCKGTYFPSMEVEVMNANGDRNKLIKYTLENVYISSFRTDHHEGQIPHEVVAFSFGKIKTEFTPVVDGKPGSPQRAGWDRDKNTAVA